MSEGGSSVAGQAGESAGSGEPWLMVRQRELDAMPGHRALAFIDYVKRIAYVFQVNVIQYRALVTRLQDPGFSLPIMDWNNPGAHDELLSEAERLLHNVLTAMSTRVDQQRRFMEKYFADDLDFTKTYTDKVDSTFQDVESVFLKRLRNHMTHRLLPVSQSSSTISTTTYEISFILPTAPLLEWDWNGDVKAWMASCGDAVEIVRVINDYARKAESFDQWLAHQIATKYAAVISAYRQAADEYNREYDRMFGS